MGSQNGNVSLDTQSVYLATQEHLTISDGLSVLDRGLPELEKELFEKWKGAAGDNYKLAAQKVENMLSGLAKRNKELAGALVDVSTQFAALDIEMANGICVDAKPASKGGI